MINKEIEKHLTVCVCARDFFLIRLVGLFFIEFSLFSIIFYLVFVGILFSEANVLFHRLVKYVICLIK